MAMADYSIPTDNEVAKKARYLLIDDLSVVYSLPSLATQCGVKPHTLKRVFKKVYGESIAEFSLRSEWKKQRNCW